MQIESPRFCESSGLRMERPMQPNMRKGVSAMTIKKSVDIPITTVEGRARIPSATAKPGDTIVWHAGTETVSIWFPRPDVFETRELADRATGDIEVVLPETAADGEFHYAVFSHDKGDFGEGNSHPILIIEKP